ncbi:hypothetical protein NDU88_004397 [Pleurodeles waltl]|uniref:Uncharacterized protein n=1 Tax=Pleurodeles waltl TaxID=8319 RepID=A0AAV7SIT4_PLEWA|nr:hypothetical protein NDU88_004397 [Pleurodeles waltl]
MAAILILGGRGESTPISPGSSVKFCRRWLLYSPAAFRCRGCRLLSLQGSIYSCYMGRAPFSDPERCAKRAASSAAGHALGMK